MIVIELATGRHPFRTESGEWIADWVVLDSIATRAIDTSEIEDARLRLLARGLTVRDSERRWGIEQVRAWLSGESPEVAEQAPAGHGPGLSASPFPIHRPQDQAPRPVHRSGRAGAGDGRLLGSGPGAL